MKFKKKTVLLLLIVSSLTLMFFSLLVAAQETPPEEPWHVTESDFENAVAEIKKTEPDFYQAIILVKNDDENNYKEMVRTWIYQQRELEETKKNDPVRYKEVLVLTGLEKKERNLAAKYRLSKDKNEKAEINKQLKEVLQKLFNKKLEVQQREVTELEERLKEVKNDIARRKSKKDLIIDRHLNDLTGETDDLAW